MFFWMIEMTHKAPQSISYKALIKAKYDQQERQITGNPQGSLRHLHTASKFLS